jgi:hypothetical protein
VPHLHAANIAHYAGCRDAHSSALDAAKTLLRVAIATLASSVNVLDTADRDTPATLATSRAIAGIRGRFTSSACHRASFVYNPEG